MRKVINLSITSMCLIIAIHVNCFASIPISSVPPPPSGCLVGSRMYTNYVRNVYVYDPADATQVTEYRYIFSSTASAPQACVSGGNVFSGTNPNGSGTVQIGCDIDKTDYASTVHNPSYENFTVVCPLDSNIWVLLLCSSGFAFFILRKKQYSLLNKKICF